MNPHPSEKIMSNLIQKQWTEHSIYAAIVNEKMEVVSIGRTSVSQTNDPTASSR